MIARNSFKETAMVFIRYLIILATLTLSSTSSAAGVYQLTLTGRIGSPYSVDRDFKQVATPPTSLSAGGTFSAEFRIDTANAYVQALYDADPTINIYYGSVSGYKAKIGAYSDTPAFAATHFASFQLWDGYNVGGVGLVDSFSVSSLRHVPIGRSPVDLGAGPISSVIGFNAFDFTATARSSDLINEITSFDGFSSKSAFVGFINADTYLQTTFSIMNLEASITAVPEPSSWALLLAGFAIAGASVRSSRAGHKETSARLTQLD